MRILQINTDNPQQRLIDQAVEALRQGAIIAYPTDTVYGIGCDIFNQKAVKKIYQIKKRDKAKPFSFICADLKDVSQYCFLSNTAYKLMKKSLPGPYTFVLPAMKIVPKIMMTKQKTVGIRVPDNNICRYLVNSLGNPLLTTTASCEEERDPLDAYDVENNLGNLVDLIIDSPCPPPAPSSVISLVTELPEILRFGKGDTALFLG
ncbi:MAG: threonylcarbamoyl-AMP synthase [Desulfobulbaceae bacterium DB1]|nr:MAG: threonylcarbamoyl-AMP synthase [Desulfobulbaceae bacterium DB1]